MRDPRTDPREGDCFWDAKGVEVRVDRVTESDVYFVRWQPGEGIGTMVKLMKLAFLVQADDAVRVALDVESYLDARTQTEG